MPASSDLQLTIRPLTPDLWPDLEDLFGKKGACNGCWCMYCRIGSAYRRQSAARNKAAFRQVVKSGPPPGLLAFHGDRAVGWCQLTPRDELPALDRSWRLKRVWAAAQVAPFDLKPCTSTSGGSCAIDGRGPS